MFKKRRRKCKCHLRFSFSFFVFEKRHHVTWIWSWASDVNLSKIHTRRTRQDPISDSHRLLTIHLYSRKGEDPGSRNREDPDSHKWADRRSQPATSIKGSWQIYLMFYIYIYKHVSMPRERRMEGRKEGRSDGGAEILCTGGGPMVN